MITQVQLAAFFDELEKVASAGRAARRLLESASKTLTPDKFREVKHYVEHTGKNVSARSRNNLASELGLYNRKRAVASSIDELPPIKPGYVRLAHNTHGGAAESIRTSGLRNHQGRIDGTTRIYSDPEDVAAYIHGTSRVGYPGTHTVLMDVSKKEARWRNNVGNHSSRHNPLSGPPVKPYGNQDHGVVNPNRIVGIIRRPEEAWGGWQAKKADVAPARPKTVLARKDVPQKPGAITGPNVELYRAQSPSNLVGSVVKKFPIRGDVGKDKAYLSYKGRF